MSILPFMLFPMTLGVSMVPNETREAAFDLGASRWQVFREVELPLSMPGIIIGFLLTFVLAVGAIAEAKILGGQTVIPITHDIEIAFTYAQNWPLGAALAVLLMLVVGILVLFVLRRFDLDAVSWGGADHAEASACRHALIWAWTIAVLVFLYIPGLCIFLASLTATRYFQFPIQKWGLDWWRQDLRLDRDPPIVQDLDQHSADRDGHRRGASPSSARSPSRATIGRAAASIRSSSCCRSSSRNRYWASPCCSGSTRIGLNSPGRLRSSRISSGSFRS